MIQQTSLEAYRIAQPKINNNQAIILKVIENSAEPMTNAEIANLLNWSINRVTPRVLELRKIGELEDQGIRKCKITKNKAHVWK